MPNPFITDEQAIETPDGSMEVPGEPTTQSVVAKEPTEGPTVEPVNPVPLPPAQPFDPYAVLERNAYSASQFVLGKDSGRTAEVLDISRQLGISPAEVDADFEGSKQRLEKLRTANTLKQSPGLSDYITNNPDKAPVLKNDLKPLTKTDILLNELAEKMAASNPAEPPKSLTYADEETEWKREDEDYEPEVKTLDGWRAGYLSGELQNEQGRMYEDLRLGKITKDAAFEKRSKEIDDTLAALDEKFKDSWLSYPTMKTIGQMLTVSGDTAAKGAALGMGAGALGLGALALAGAPVAVPASLGALGLMTMSGAVMETSKEVEGGLAYKDMREAGIDDDVARRLSGTVGFVNGSLEAIGDAVLTKFGGKLLGITGFKQMFGQKVKEKTIEALKKPTFRAAAVDVAKAFTTGLATEVGVEELQEISNIVAEEAAKKLTKDVQFDSITPDEVMDRLADIGIETIKGVWALGLAGGAVGMTRHISKIKTAQRNQEFFENLNQIAPEITARETAPGVVSEAVQNQAESAGKPTIYVDGEMFAQTMQEKNVRLEDLKKINPELVNAIQKAVASGGDVEISTGDYAALIAGTPFGEALTQHLRFNPDELSAYEAKKARKLVSDWVGQNDWDLSTEEGREAATKEINQAVNQVQKSKYAQAFDDLTKSMTQSLMASGISGYREERIAKQYARLQAASIVRLAKDANIAPERIAEFAPRIESSNVTRDAFFQEPLDAAEKLRADAQQWKETVDKLTAKPRQQLIMLRQTPLIMKLLGADFQELRSSTHVFDGVYPGNKSRDEHHEHLMMTKDVIKQIPEAITDPVIVARDERHNSFVFFLDIKDANGESVMVPVSFEHPTEKKPVVFNIVKSAFGRGRLQLELQGRNNALLYINIKKLKSLYGTPGADSLRSVKDFNAVLKNYFSNADGSSVKTEADLVKLRELFSGYYQTSIQDPLITVHNISEENLNKSLNLGGFAVPSLGITKQRTPYEGFGEITLIGTRDMIDPEKGTPVFSQDIYSKMFPDIVLQEDKPFVEIDGSLKPLTLENAVLAMTSGPIKNQGGGSFGMGNIGASTAKRFKNLKEIQADREKVTDSDTVSYQTMLMDSRITNFKYDASQIPGADMDARLKAQETVVQDLAKVVANDGEITEARVREALSGYNASDDVVRQGVDILNRIKESVTDYFEAKPQRAVGADEFRGAVVPEGTSEATIRRLEKAGITVAKYDAEVEGARERVIRDLTNRLNEKTGDILFQNEKIEPQSINVSATEVFAKLGLDLPEGFKPTQVTLISTKPVTENSNIEEFSGAVLPDNAPKELVDALEEKGIRVELSSNRKTAREKAVSQLSQKIQDSLVYFQNGTNERGGYSPKQNTIHLTPNADLSTFAHEMSHWYLENLMQLAGETGVSGLIKQDAETLLKDFGLKSLDEWKNLSIEEKRKFHERFAYQTEIYLATGKPHNPKLITVFKNLGKWIRDVYRAWTGGVAEQRAAQYKSEFGEELPQLSEEVQRVMDRMLNAEADLYQAEVSESMRPLFDEKPKDMSEEDWIAMQKAHDEALADGEALLNEAKAKDEKWYSNARAKTLRMIQRKAKEIRDKVKEGVTAEIEAEAGTRAYELIKKSNETFGINWKFDPDALTAAKISSSAIKKLSALGLTKKGGMAPSEVMELMRGQGNAFATVQDMVQGLLEGARKDERIEKETTRRCIEKYSENFTQAGIDAQITEALQNEARARFVATEFKYLAGSPAGISQRMINEAAKRSAELMLANMPVYNVNPRNFVAMQARASRKAYEALASGDKGRAAAYKRQQLMYLQAALQALDVDKQVDRFERIRKKTFSADKKLAKTYDLDVLNVLRAVFNIEGLGRTKPEDVDLLAVEKRINAFKDMAPPVYEMLSGVFSRYKGINGGQGYSNLTYGDFQSLAEDVSMLFAMSRQWKETTREAKAEAREQAAKELIAQMNTQNLTYHSVGQTEATTPFEKFRQDGLLSLGSSLVRVESWCNKMDTGNPNHPFRSHIYDPIAQATAKFRNRNSELQQKLAELIKPQQKDWLSRTDIHAPTLNYTFRTKAELIGALLHTGNESNKEKLLLGGRGEGNAWAEMVEDQEGNTKLDTKRWDQFIAQCYADGTITKADMDFVQLVWNLLESTKEDAQKAYKDLYGYTFKEIEASPIQTPWGEYRGGYVPATTDKYLVADKATFDEIDRITEQDYLSAMPVSQPGFTKSRASGYHEPLSFDVAIISNHISSVLKFCYIAPVAQDVGKLLLNKDLSEKLNAQDPTTLRDMLKPWLKRSYSQQVSDGRSGWVSKKLNELRGIAGINIMMGHIVNALQQFTGFSIALTKVSGRNLIDAAGVFARDPRKVTEQITQLSPFMMSRLNDRAMEFQSQVYKISSTQDNRVTKQKGIFNKTVAAKAKYIQPVHDFLMRKGYFLQSLCQIPIDAITWVGAYNQALQKGLTTEEAVLDADSVIRTTMSDFSPENVANVETGNALYRSFLVFYNYFNMQFNLLNERFHADSMEKKLIKRYGMYARDALLVVTIPSVVAKLIEAVVFGDPDTGDDDEFGMDDMLRMLASESFKNAVAMAPIAGQFINTAGASLAKDQKGGAVSDVARFIWGTDPYVGRIMTAPAYSLIEGSGKAIQQTVEILNDEDVNARSYTRNMLDLLSVVTGLPLGFLKKPLGYMAGVEAGDIQPADAGEFVQGVLSGRAKKD